MNLSGNDVPSVITSEVYNDAEVTFNLLQNKEKLISFLDCTTLLRGMGMNPTHDDMDRLKARMAEPVLRLEQWRREEELKREKERRKEEMRDKKKRGSVAATAAPRRKSMMEKAVEGAEQKAVKIVPVEEIKNIDWNIFISCAEEIYRDSATEEKDVFTALKAFQVEGKPGIMKRDRLIRIVSTNGDNILSPAEVKQLTVSLPEQCSFEELAARIQGTYVPPTQEELDRIAAEAYEEKLRKEEAERAAAEAAADPLAGL